MRTTDVAEPRVEQISAASATELATRTQQMRFLVAELGLTRPQAHALIRAYQYDVADSVRIGNDTGRSDASFIEWLMRQAPGGRRTTVRQWRIGESAWRTAS